MRTVGTVLDPVGALLIADSVSAAAKKKAGALPTTRQLTGI